MGCCMSSHDNRATQPSSEPHLQFVSKSPPRPEEESVKEVLSETPNLKPRPDLDPRPEFMIPINVAPKADYEEEEEPPSKPRIKKTRPSSPDPTPPEEISDLSEMSESVSTNTLRDREEDDLQVQQWSKINRYRPQGQNGHLVVNNRSVSAGRSPGKRVEPSPPRRRNPSPVARRDPGENSGRRSGSPGGRGNVGRSPSGRRTGPSPGRVRMVQPLPQPPKVEDDTHTETDNDWNGPNESLENPLVSLECFIFL